MVIESHILKQLRKIVGKQHCSWSAEDRACYAYDATGMRHLPDAVLFPQNTEEIAAILRLANTAKFAVVPRGSGSGMTGGSVPIHGGVVLVMTRLNQIIQIDHENFTATVQPGLPETFIGQLSKRNYFIRLIRQVQSFQHWAVI
jgi:glycolate dehydrogenase FAD-linked subunit